MRFSRYHALGNDYLVLDPADVVSDLTPPQVRLVCHRHYGIGADGVLLGPIDTSACDFGLRFFNPDGGEFEKKDPQPITDSD